MELPSLGGGVLVRRDPRGLSWRRVPWVSFLDLEFCEFVLQVTSVLWHEIDEYGYSTVESDFCSTVFEKDGRSLVRTSLGT